MPRALKSFHLLLLLLLGLLGHGFAKEPEWVEVRSPHFSVVTDAGERRGRETALHFEQMRVVFGTLMSKSKVTLPVPLQIVAFRNTKEMRQFVPLWNGKPTQVAGLFQGGSDRSFIMIDMSVEDPLEVVFHEYAHQLLNGNVPARLPLWFDEGFAEYFSTIKITGKQADVGLSSAWFGAMLTQQRLMKVADLFRVEHDSSTYNESGDHRSIFYVESWLVFHYINDKQWMPKVVTYLNLANDRKLPVEEAIQQAFGMSTADFDRELQQYILGRKILHYPVPVPEGIDNKDYSVKSLAAPEAKAVLADVHLHSQDYREQAMGEFKEVLKLQPDNAVALRGLGYGYLMKQDYQQAGEYFGKAVEHDSTDPRVLYYSAVLAQREGLGGDRERLDVVQKQLEKSIALDPDFADAYNILAWAQMASGDHEKALQTMLKAMNLDPRNESYAYNLGQMYFMNRKYDEAIAIWRPLTSGTNFALARQAAEAITTAENIKQFAQSGTKVEILVDNDVQKEPETSTPIPPAVTGPAKFLKGN